MIFPEESFIMYAHILNVFQADIKDIARIIGLMTVHADSAARGDRDKWSIKLEETGTIMVWFTRKDDLRAFERKFKAEHQAIEAVCFERRRKRDEWRRLVEKQFNL